ncbi:hypothetical protein [Actinophytocola gossypii]|uniref:DUF393 domain-containing protein n=1 Tax=Actinophytocola gossypii TaxID=2812003 RepID=A0ABT2J3V3_9PSEU|nr:hypothetical protein [Actinophytocola gossypii]MCT2582436.1 hypothetical protein [Actinophytocola gossypii]
MTLYPVPLRGDGDNDVAHCRLRSDNEPTWRDLDVPVWEPRTPDFSGDAVISCDLAVTVQTGTVRSISEITRQGPAIGVPLAMAVIGGFLFVPRFVHAMAHVSNPRWVRRLLKLPPPR